MKSKYLVELASICNFKEEKLKDYGDHPRHTKVMSIAGDDNHGHLKEKPKEKPP